MQSYPYVFTQHLTILLSTLSSQTSSFRQVLLQKEEVCRHVVTGDVVVCVTVCGLVQEEEVYEQRSAGLRQELDAMRAAAARFDGLHCAAAAEVARLKEAQSVEQGQAYMLLKQGAGLKRDNHLLKVICWQGELRVGFCRSKGRDEEGAGMGKDKGGVGIYDEGVGVAAGGRRHPPSTHMGRRD